MIIDFTVQNFRSFKTEQILTMHVEHPKVHLAEHVAFPVDQKIGVLRSVGIYGANASGKSNILAAFQALQYIGYFSGDLKEGQEISCYEPYLLSEETKEAPTRFEIEFIVANSKRYRYEVSFNRSEILEETLDFYPSRQKANIFRRGINDTWETISFGGLYKGGAKRIPFFKNNSYLSKAGNNAASAEIIRSIYHYFLLNLGQQTMFETMLGPNFYDDDDLLGTSAKFLKCIDTGILSIEHRANPDPPENVFPSNFPVELKTMLEERAKKRYYFSHENENGGIEKFNLDSESQGTQKLFSMLPTLIRTFERGRVFIIDEIDASFHPHISELLISLFNDPEVNIKNSQLIFTTHSMNLMAPRKMRRDQIWFVKKDLGKSNLYSLADFDKDKVKSDSPFETWYNEGRFGALPKIRYDDIAKLLSSQLEAKSETHLKEQEVSEGGE